MGIGRTEAKKLLDAVKIGTDTKKKLREQLGDAINFLQEYTAKLDTQVTASLADFAASNSSQYDTFLDGLPLPADPSDDGPTP